MVKKIYKKRYFISAIIICLIIMFIPHDQDVYAYADDGATESIVYQDGIRYEITLDDEMNVIVTSETETGEVVYTEIDDSGNFVFETNDAEGEDQYTGKINELSTENVDVEVVNQEGKTVETYTDLEQLDCSDTYQGQTEFVLATGVVITFAQVLSVLIDTGIVLVISSLAYITAGKFVDKVNAISNTSSKSKAKDMYYRAYIAGDSEYGSNIFIGSKGISVTKAAEYIKLSAKNHVYSFTSSMAKAAIIKAGYTATAVENHYDSNNAKNGWFYSHYHPRQISGRNRPHSFFGTGKLRKDYGTGIG